ncbi:hypothetical protein HPB50_024255 [Hyalomma asiaticum]|uniref:Uncharacterized protein n=1 Tax=Hyalomma asiaticum TaxID=266040 RepID=A0ACB7S951_HYAAI|nr:hypothetical protein HPB50_024255 [Hyalomma asiaticum]
MLFSLYKTFGNFVRISCQAPIRLPPLLGFSIGYLGISSGMDAFSEYGHRASPRMIGKRRRDLCGCRDAVILRHLSHAVEMRQQMSTPRELPAHENVLRIHEQREGRNEFRFSSFAPAAQNRRHDGTLRIFAGAAREAWPCNGPPTLSRGNNSCDVTAARVISAENLNVARGPAWTARLSGN